MKNKYFFTLAALACILLFIGFSCSKSTYSTTGGTPPPGGTATVNVSMNNMTFSPATVTVAKGTIIKWTNNDYYYAHQPVSDDGGATFESTSVPIGGTFSYTTFNSGS